MCCLAISASMYSSTLSACARASAAENANSSRQHEGENRRARQRERVRGGRDIGAPEQGGGQETSPAIGSGTPDEGLNYQQTPSSVAEGASKDILTMAG